MDNGIYQISAKEYHAAKGISASQLKAAHKSMAHWEQFFEPSEPTPAMMMGTALHTMVLEPDKIDSEIAIAPKVDRRTKAGKDEWSKFQEEAGGKLIIEADKWDDLKAMSEAIMDHPFIVSNNVFQGGEAEYSYFYDGLKVRPDYFNDGVLYDLKTTVDPSPQGFQRQAYSLGYHIQLAFYADVMKETSKREGPVLNVDQVRIISVSNSKPFICTVFEVSPDFLALGKQHYQAALDRIREYKAAYGAYNGYSADPVILNAPHWV